jgi:hypothetical protein
LAGELANVESMNMEGWLYWDLHLGSASFYLGKIEKEQAYEKNPGSILWNHSCETLGKLSFVTLNFLLRKMSIIISNFTTVCLVCRLDVSIPGYDDLKKK